MNHQDSTAFLGCFAAAAIVEDEGKTHRGCNEIKTWIEAAFANYRPLLEVECIVPTAGGTVITGFVSGTFPGSPIKLHYHLTHDADQITALRCSV
jgi:hypothetical protein